MHVSELDLNKLIVSLAWLVGAVWLGPWFAYLTIAAIAPLYPGFGPGQLSSFFGVVILKVSLGLFAATATLFLVRDCARTSRRAVDQGSSFIGEMVSGCGVWCANAWRSSLFIKLSARTAEASSMHEMWPAQSGKSDAELLVVFIPGTWSGKWSRPTWQGISDVLSRDHPGIPMYIWTWRAYNSWQARVDETTVLAERLEALTKQTGAKAILVGHSHGGTLAVNAAALKPACVERIVTVGTPLFTLRRAASFGESFGVHQLASEDFSGFLLRLYLIWTAGHRAFVNVWQDGLALTPGRNSNDLVSGFLLDGAVLALMAVPMILKRRTEARTTAAAGMMMPSSNMPKLASPCLVVQAQGDPIFQAAQRMESQARRARFISLSTAVAVRRAMLDRRLRWGFLFLPTLIVLVFAVMDQLAQRVDLVREIGGALQQASRVLFRDDWSMAPFIVLLSLILLNRRNTRAVGLITPDLVTTLAGLPLVVWRHAAASLLGVPRDSLVNASVSWSTLPEVEPGTPGPETEMLDLAGLPSFAQANWLRRLDIRANWHSGVLGDPRLINLLRRTLGVIGESKLAVTR